MSDTTALIDALKRAAEAERRASVAEAKIAAALSLANSAAYTSAISRQMVAALTSADTVDHQRRVGSDAAE